MTLRLLQDNICATRMRRIGPITLFEKIKPVADAFCRPMMGYRIYLRYLRGALGPFGFPKSRPENAVLASKVEWNEAVEETTKLGLPKHPDLQKNWDSLSALSCVLRRTNPDAYVMDAGAEKYSAILPCLFLYGYRNLVGVNLAFRRATRRGPVRYEPGDITKTRFPDNTFDAITCLSVIEHGVDLKRFFDEMFRILKPGGALFTSTDYWADPIDTKGITEYGTPVRIFTRTDILEVLEFSKSSGLLPTGEVDLMCHQKAVRWVQDRYPHEYTFLVFTLTKPLSAPGTPSCA